MIINFKGTGNFVFEIRLIIIRLIYIIQRSTSLKSIQILSKPWSQFKYVSP